MQTSLMTCKKKKSTLVLSQPHVQMILPQVLLVTGTPECLGQAASLYPSRSSLLQTSPEGQRDWDLLFCPSLPFWLHAYAFSPARSPSPGFWGTPGANWGMHVYKPCTGSRYKRCRRTQDPEMAPIP